MKDNRKRSVAVIAAWCALAVMPLFGQSADGAYEIGEDLALSLDKWEQSADDFIVDRGKNGFSFSDNRRREGQKDAFYLLLPKHLVILRHIEPELMHHPVHAHGHGRMVVRIRKRTQRAIADRIGDHDISSA